jgi:hypothetical protein
LGVEGVRFYGFDYAVEAKNYKDYCGSNWRPYSIIVPVDCYIKNPPKEHWIRIVRSKHTIGHIAFVVLQNGTWDIRLRYIEKESEEPAK